MKIRNHSAKALVLMGVMMAGALLSTQSRAAFHLWEISQVFSNADGSVQYIELFNNANFEQFLSGQQVIVSRDGGQDQQSFTFPSNLPSSSTAGRNVLLATGTIAGVEPDYIIPENFIHIDFQSNAMVSLPFSDLGTADITYSEIPTDGWRSLNVSGTIRAPATVTNFAGDTGALQEPDPSPTPTPTPTPDPTPDPTPTPTPEPELAYGFAVEADLIEAPFFLGLLYVGDVPWVFNHETQAWWYIPGPENDLTAVFGAWAWVMGVDESHFVQELPNWVFSTATSNWWYLHNPDTDLTGEGGWAFLVNMGSAE